MLATGSLASPGHAHHVREEENDGIEAIRQKARFRGLFFGS